MTISYYATVGWSSSPDYRVKGAGDFNGDGNSDIAWQSDANEQVTVWLIDGVTPIRYAQRSQSKSRSAPCLGFVLMSLLAITRHFRNILFLVAWSSASLIHSLCAEEIKPDVLTRTILESVSERRMNEARARLLEPNLDEQDVSLLTNDELDVSPANLNWTDKPFPREPSPRLVPKVADAINPEMRYRYSVLLSEIPRRELRLDLLIDPLLPAPNIDVDLSNPLFPKLKIPRLKSADGNEALHYFEFDTVPSFNSPNLWRYPTLKPIVYSPAGVIDIALQNLTGREDLSFEILGTTQRGVTGHENEIRFPFRSTAMRLPENWRDLTYDELERHALAIGYGLSPQDLISEIYRYGRHAYVWGSDTMSRSPLDVFAAGIGECSALNNTIGALLEMNGLRYRIVSGFDPKLRVAMPSNGHSAIEVFDPELRAWSYVDSYHDILLPGTSAEALARQPEAAASELPVLQILAPHLQPIYGQWVRLKQLFKYRRYGDNLTRSPMTSMLQLAAGPGEANYGFGWSLNVLDPRQVSELFAERKTIYVRARYVLAGSHTLQTFDPPAQPLRPSDQVVGTPWGSTSFDIAPQTLMASYRAPKLAEKTNLCKDRAKQAIKLKGPFPHESGFAFISKFDAVRGDDLAATKRSSILLCEDENPMGPAHAIHDEIRMNGQGRYSHWNDHLYFSASDNSDPNANGRSYAAIDVGTEPTGAAYMDSAATHRAFAAPRP